MPLNGANKIRKKNNVNCINHKSEISQNQLAPSRTTKNQPNALETIIHDSSVVRFQFFTIFK